MGGRAMTVLIDSPRLWEQQAACGENPELFHTRPGNGTWARVSAARHVCLYHCPVRQQCEENIPPMRSAIVGGIYYNNRAEPSEYQPLDKRCARCTPGRRT